MAETGEKSGAKAAIEALGGVGAPRAAQAAQGELLPAALPLDGLSNAEQNSSADRGAGRPKGARNRRTQEFIDDMLAITGKSPGEVLARRMVEDPIVLAKRLNIAVEEADKRIHQAAEALLPYFHQKLPQAIELDRGVVDLIINVGSAPVKTLDHQPVAVEIIEPEKSEENQ
jgi:hypothetical protein